MPMMSELTANVSLPSLGWLLPALLVGLSGGLHCAGMCGGVVSAMASSHGYQPSAQTKPAAHNAQLAVSTREAARATVRAQPLLPAASLVHRQLAYNAGRLITYALLGAAIGWIGQWSTWLSSIAPVQRALYALANVMLVLLGLNLARIWRGTLPFERHGMRLWKHLQPLAGKLLMAPRLHQALMAGMVWGLVPCGMVYSMLAVAIATADPLRGAAWMLAFGIGTLPNLLLIGALSIRLTRWFDQQAIRWAAGAIVAALGLIGLARALGWLAFPAGDPFCIPATS